MSAHLFKNNIVIVQHIMWNIIQFHDWWVAAVEGTAEVRDDVEAQIAASPSGLVFLVVDGAFDFSDSVAQLSGEVATC